MTKRKTEDYLEVPMVALATLVVTLFPATPCRAKQDHQEHYQRGGCNCGDYLSRRRDFFRRLRTLRRSPGNARLVRASTIAVA